MLRVQRPICTDISIGTFPLGGKEQATFAFKADITSGTSGYHAEYESGSRKRERKKGRESLPIPKSGFLREKRWKLAWRAKKGELGVERRKVSSVMIINQSIFIPLSPRPSPNCTPKPLMFT